MLIFETLASSLRTIRAAVVGGWLWIVVAWTLLPASFVRDGHLPVSARLIDVSDALGPGGLLVLGTFAAFAIGSLATDIIDAGGTRLVARRCFPDNRARELIRPGTQRLGSFLSISVAALAIPSASRGALGHFRRAEAKARALINHALHAPCTALENALVSHADLPVCVIFVSRDFVAVSLDDSADAQAEIPIMPSTRRLFEEAETIRLRLGERLPITANGVERLYGEAQLRIAIAVPLALLALVTVVRGGQASFASFLVVGGAGVLLSASLGLQALAIHGRAMQQLIEAIRTRPPDVELETLTPIMARYAERADGFAAALRNIAHPTT